MEERLDELQALRERVSQLERRRRSWRFWVVFALIVAQTLVVVALHQAVYSTADIVTQKVTIVDAGGRIRGILSCTEDQVGLVFLNQNGKPCGMFTVGDNGFTSLNINDSKGNGKITLGTNQQGGSVLVLSGAKRDVQGMFWVSVGDSSIMELRDPDSSVVFRAPVAKDEG